ncbi:hypothetical protein CC78DRAFT_532791 [Lojkania enalia]|uniref:Ankyrin repeat protein n=1 Tax=Lojkania enalia TaxID=147567 RepID=A0A9P4KA66_9PLEO|nr:hypothetical protein CC78DRAFT_532791 [Didymosphaeria enalia]
MEDNSLADLRRLILEACRYDNSTLLEEVIEEIAERAEKEGRTRRDYVAEVLNYMGEKSEEEKYRRSYRDKNHIREKDKRSYGLTYLHIAAEYGSYDVVETLLDQFDVEIDGKDTSVYNGEGDTPLHKAVRFVNSKPPSQWEDLGYPLIYLLVDAGCNPMEKNMGLCTPKDLVDPTNTALIEFLADAEKEYEKAEKAKDEKVEMERVEQKHKLALQDAIVEDKDESTGIPSDNE